MLKKLKIYSTINKMKNKVPDWDIKSKNNLIKMSTMRKMKSIWMICKRICKSLIIPEGNLPNPSLKSTFPTQAIRK